LNGSVARDLRKGRVRITAIATLALVLVLVVAGFAVIRLFEREVMRQVDTRLVRASERVAELVSGSVPLPRMDTPEDLFQVVDFRGDVAYSGPALEGEPALWSEADGTEPHSEETGRGMVRVIAVPFRDGAVVLAEPLQPVEDDVQSLQKAMLLGLPPLALILAALVWVVVGRALRPVAAAVEREERLVADVSHELRSPLAGLRVLLETEPNEPQQVELSRIEALETLARLETITDQLLMLTRQDQRSATIPRNPVDLDEIVLNQAVALAPRSPVHIDTNDVGPGQVLGREDDLVSMVDNLLANSVRHARAAVKVSVVEEANAVELAVDDDGPGIAVGDRDRIFDRFTRLDEARSRDQGGAGLGLAIVRAILVAHEGSIVVEDSTLGGARFVVRLPASTPSPPSDASSPPTAGETVRPQVPGVRTGAGGAA
jgi:signal transduction histidine kinase